MRINTFELKKLENLDLQVFFPPNQQQNCLNIVFELLSILLSNTRTIEYQLKHLHVSYRSYKGRMTISSYAKMFHQIEHIINFIFQSTL